MSVDGSIVPFFDAQPSKDIHLHPKNGIVESTKAVTGQHQTVNRRFCPTSSCPQKTPAFAPQGDEGCTYNVSFWLRRDARITNFSGRRVGILQAFDRSRRSPGRGGGEVVVVVAADVLTLTRIKSVVTSQAPVSGVEELPSHKDVRQTKSDTHMADACRTSGKTKEGATYTFMTCTPL